MFAIGGVLCLLTASPGLLLAQNLPDAPAPHAADPHIPKTASRLGSGTGSASGNESRAASGSDAQQSTASPPQADATQTTDSKQTPKSTAGDNPFPEEESKKAAAAAGTTETPAADSAGKKSAADENPFPEDRSEAAAKAAGAATGTSESGESDTDALGVSSSRKSAAEPAAAVDLPKEGELAVAADPKRAAKDAQVGKYYLDAGDYKGAYARFKEASTLSPEDAQIAFLLAESARKLNHLDEALKNYKLCLQLDPDGPKAKSAKRALAGFDKLASR